MKTFNIEIKEVLVKKIAIESNSIDEALVEVKQLYNSENILLDSSNHFDTIIYEDTIENAETIRMRLTDEVIDYLIDDERKHFEELGTEPQDHIYLKLLKLKTLNNN
jgi:hypothetical protein